MDMKSGSFNNENIGGNTNKLITTNSITTVRKNNTFFIISY